MRSRTPALLAALAAALTLLAPAPAGAAPDPLPLPAGVDADYQLGGAASPAPGVGIVVRDRTEEPAGRYDVCYVNGFQTQPDARPFWRRHDDLLLRDADGRLVADEAWGEWLLDLRTPARRERLARIVGRWVDGCARDGFEAVELDNLDSFTRSDGLLRARHATAYARLLTARAHAAGLAVGQKNRAGWDGRRAGFDFAVAEECGRYDECDAYTADYGHQVVAVEYRAADFRRACAAIGEQVAVVLRDRDLTPDGVRRWC